MQEASRGSISKRRRISIDLKNEEFWLNRLGIGLLLLGVGFLFKYSIDQGWLTTAVRLGFGLVLGITLFVAGVRLKQRRSALSQVLLGGSIGTFYITIFAAYQLYQLLPYLAAFLSMVAVTLLAFFMSLRENHAVLSVVGAVGGLGTPFVLYSGQGSLVMLVGYTCLILIGTSAIYLRQGWRSLLWTTFFATWLIFGVGYDQMEVGANITEQIALQVGVLFGGLAFAGLPTLKVVRQVGQPSRRSRNPVSRSSTAKTRQRYLSGYGSAQILCVIIPLLIISFTGSIWSLEPRSIGWVAFAVASLYSYLGYWLRQRRALRPLGNSHLLSACLMFTFALPTQLSGNGLFLVLALEAVLVHWFAQRFSARSLSAAAYLLTVTVGIWLLHRVGSDTALSPIIINSQAMTDLAVVAVFGGLSWRIRHQNIARVYQGLITVALVLWFWRELSVLPNGMSYVTVAWSLEALVLSWLARRTSAQIFWVLAYLLSGISGLWLLQRLLSQTALSPALINSQGLANFAGIVIIWFISRLIPSPSVARIYQILLHIAVLIWFWRELSVLPNGSGYVTISWGIYAIALLIIGLYKDWQNLRWAAIATLFLVVLKLFLYDLANLEALWRILLFLGFGGTFLGLSYGLQVLWKPKSPSKPDQ